MPLTKSITKNKIKDTYPLVNIVFAGIILLLFIYSGIFSQTGIKYPIKCTQYAKTGITCETCGLSRSFTEIIHFNIKEARNYSTHGIPIFLFFLIQLFTRIIGSILYLKTKIANKFIIITDVLFTIGSFILTFKNLIIQI